MGPTFSVSPNEVTSRLVLPIQTESKLSDSGIERRARPPERRKVIDVMFGDFEVRAVEQVKEVPLKCGGEPFAELELFRYPKVHVGVSGTGQGVSSLVAVAPESKVYCRVANGVSKYGCI
jgi:hypothetical protein